MRIVAIGLGGAGCRIVASLYATDRRSSNVACVESLVIDVDEKTLTQLEGLPEQAKIFFPALDPGSLDESDESPQTATIDIGEIISRVQNFEAGETDAIMICCGLGGSMVDVAPHIIAGLRSSIVEPIFGLITLPCLAEGEKRSGKAAEDIEMLSPLLDGVILFDNETWYKKTKAMKATLIKKDKGLKERLGFGKGRPEISSELATYLLLNEAIVRRISLILRAGEFKADGGIDLAEVVLDSGEVLNTMKGMGFITIGYAVEKLPHDPLSFLSRWKPAGLFADEHKRKASRIVELAKQAIYNEISTPCDLTSAHKALILVAGPSHEISMKGYMTVRKWIDRSIAGLETRSGDYPVMNTKNLAIIIMLSGLENIPRIEELREIRAQYKSQQQNERAMQEQSLTGAVTNAGKDASSPKISGGKFKDEMIVFSGKTQKSERSDIYSSGQVSHFPADPYAREYDRPQKVLPESVTSPHQTDSVPKVIGKKTIPHLIKKPYSIEETSTRVLTDDEDIPKRERDHIPRHRVIVDSGHEELIKQSVSRHPSHVSSAQEISQNRKITTESDPHESDSTQRMYSNDNIMRTREMERQRIEKELQRQRMAAISGRMPKTGVDTLKHRISTPEITGLKKEIANELPPKEKYEPSDPVKAVQKEPERRTVIVAKRRVTSLPQETKYIPENKKEGVPVTGDDLTGEIHRETHSREADSEEKSVGMKESFYRAKDDIFEGKGIRRYSAPHARDSALIHTDLKPKKSTGNSRDEPEEKEHVDPMTESSQPPKKREKKITKHDDISWI